MRMISTLRAEWSAETDIEYTVLHYVERVDSGINPETESSGGTFVTMTDSSGTERIYYLYAAVNLPRRGSPTACRR